MGRGLRNGSSGTRLIEIAAVLAVLASAVGGAVSSTHGAVQDAALLALASLYVGVLLLVFRGWRG